MITPQGQIYLLIGLGFYIGVAVCNAHTFRGATFQEILRGIVLGFIFWPLGLGFLAIENDIFKVPSRYQMVKIGEKYAVRKRNMFGQWVYFRVYGGWQKFEADHFSGCEWDKDAAERIYNRLNNIPELTVIK